MTAGLCEGLVELLLDMRQAIGGDPQGVPVASGSGQLAAERLELRLQLGNRAAAGFHDGVEFGFEVRQRVFRRPLRGQVARRQLLQVRVAFGHHGAEPGHFRGVITCHARDRLEVGADRLQGSLQFAVLGSQLRPVVLRRLSNPGRDSSALRRAPGSAAGVLLGLSRARGEAPPFQGGAVEAAAERW